MMTITENPTERCTPLCPDWCTSNGYEHECDTRLREGGPVTDHHGPSFGPFGCYASETFGADASLTRFVAVSDIDTVDDLATAEQLRQFAADALAAAEWLEAQA